MTGHRLPSPEEFIFIMLALIGFVVVIASVIGFVSIVVEDLLSANLVSEISSGLPWLVAGAALGAFTAYHYWRTR